MDDLDDFYEFEKECSDAIENWASEDEADAEREREINAAFDAWFRLVAKDCPERERL